MISGIIYTDLSDNLPIFLFSDLNIIPKPEPKTYTTRQVTSHSLEQFQRKLQNVNWDVINNETMTTNQLYTSFMNILQPIYNDCFPVRTFTTQTRKNTKPWFTNGLYNSSMKNDRLYKNYLQNPDISTKTTYTNYRNKYNYLVKLARKSYYHNKLLNHQSDLRLSNLMVYY
jgi:hypothetical protein